MKIINKMKIGVYLTINRYEFNLNPFNVEYTQTSNNLRTPGLCYNDFLKCFQTTVIRETFSKSYLIRKALYKRYFTIYFKLK